MGRSRFGLEQRRLLHTLVERIPWQRRNCSHALKAALEFTI
jgi:hypothetical protein